MLFARSLHLSTSEVWTVPSVGGEHFGKTTIWRNATVVVLGELQEIVFSTSAPPSSPQATPFGLAGSVAHGGDFLQRADGARLGVGCRWGGPAQTQNLVSVAARGGGRQTPGEPYR